jgi:hypothetical protein
LLITYGIRDCEPWFGSVDADDVRVLLGQQYGASSWWVARNFQFANYEPPLTDPLFSDEEWVRGQTNRALLDGASCSAQSQEFRIRQTLPLASREDRATVTSANG